MATLIEIHERLARGETITLRYRYVADVLDGLAPLARSGEQYVVKRSAQAGSSAIALERACRECYQRYTGPACTHSGVSA